MKNGTPSLPKKKAASGLPPVDTPQAELQGIIAANLEAAKPAAKPKMKDTPPPPPAAPSPPPVAALEHSKRKIHVVKMSQDFFDAYDKKKRIAQVRNNDRNYQPNDLMINREFSDLLQAFTGREFMCRIDDVSTPPGLQTGHVLLHTKVV